MAAKDLFAWILLLATLVAACPSQATTVTNEESAGLYQEAMQLIAEGRYDDARLALDHLVDKEPEHAGAWLDIAILQCSMGHATEAEALFSAIENKFSPPPVILEVIAQQRTRGCAGQTSSTHTRLRLGRGVDSNVNQGASNPNFSIGSGSNLVNLVLSPEYAPRSDHFSAFSAELTRPLSPGGTIGFAQFQARQYDTLSQFNLNSLTIGAEHPWRAGNWLLRGSASLGLITLGGAVYQKQSSLQLQANPPLTLPTGWTLGLVGGWTHVAYSSLTGFDSQIWESRGVLTYQNADTLVRASMGYAFDSGTKQRPGSDRSGAAASLTGRTRLSGEIFGELSWNQQRWEGQQAYSPGLIDQHRQQDTRLLRAALSVPLSSQQAIHLELRDVRNRENISLFEYQGRLLQLSWQWQTAP